MCVSKDIAAIGVQKPISIPLLQLMPVRKAIAEKDGVYFVLTDLSFVPCSYHVRTMFVSLFAAGEDGTNKVRARYIYEAKNVSSLAYPPTARRRT